VIGDGWRERQIDPQANTKVYQLAAIRYLGTFMRGRRQVSRSAAVIATAFTNVAGRDRGLVPSLYMWGPQF